MLYNPNICVRFYSIEEKFVDIIKTRDCPLSNVVEI